MCHLFNCMKRIWWWIRRNIKWFTCYVLCRWQYVCGIHLFSILSYCHRCGGDVCDYKAPDNLWKEAQAQAKESNLMAEDKHWSAGVFCFNCFIELLEERGILYFPLLGPEEPDDVRLLYSSKKDNHND